MKQFISMQRILIILSCVILLGCKKQKEIRELARDIEGIWEIERTLCGECITHLQVYPPGNGNIIVLSSIGNFQRLKHDTSLFKGSYTLEYKKDCYERNSNTRLSTNDTSFVSGFYVKVDDDKLIFDAPNCYLDGVITIYRRIR